MSASGSPTRSMRCAPYGALPDPSPGPSPQRSHARPKAPRSAASRSSGPAVDRRRAHRRRSCARSIIRGSPIADASCSPARARASIARRIRGASRGARSRRRRSTMHAGHGRIVGCSRYGPAQVPQTGQEKPARRTRSERTPSSRSSSRTQVESSRRSVSVPATVTGSPSKGHSRTRSPARRPVTGQTTATGSASRSGQGSGSSNRTVVGPRLGPAVSGQSSPLSIHQSSVSRASLRARVSTLAASARVASPVWRSGWVRPTRVRQARVTSS